MAELVLRRARKLDTARCSSTPSSQTTAQHNDLALDVIVTTNPYCRGFAPTTLDAVANAGAKIMTLQDFLGSLGEPWDR